MKNMPISQLILSFLEHLEVERNCSRLTIRNYHHYLNRFTRWYQDNQHQHSILTLDLEVIKKYRLFLSRWLNEKGKGLSMVTQGYHVIALRSFLKWLIKNDME